MPGALAPLPTQSGHRAVLHFICALMNEADIHRSALSRLLLRNLRKIKLRHRSDDTLAKKSCNVCFKSMTVVPARISLWHVGTAPIHRIVGRSLRRRDSPCRRLPVIDAPAATFVRSEVVGYGKS